MPPDARWAAGASTVCGSGRCDMFAKVIIRRLIFSAFILTFIGAVLSAKKMKNGLGINLVIGFALCLAYILATSLTSQIANVGLMAPWIAAWIPNVAFIIAALLLWRKAPQ